MADNSLRNPVVIQATRIDATLLPRNIFSQPYLLYVIQQGTDLGNVASKANDAGQGAWDAQVKNDEQDLVLANHESRIEAAEATLVNHEQRIKAAETTLANHEQRITAAETKLENHEQRISTAEETLINHEERITQNKNDISALDTRLNTAKSDIDTLKTNSISKAVSTSQSVQATGGSFFVGNVPAPTTDKLQVGGSVNASVSYKVAGLQVLGARQTGWTAATGTANKGAFDADKSFSTGYPPTQEEIQALVDGLVETRRRLKAMEDMARTHGLIA
ncbi:Membrane-bound metallopeptidase [Klebsiella electrica]|uniref:phage tail protein n=1 Tax=Klebsiella electrica TaxID=1259973 RepID=UPI001163AAC2|nr:phage tail protein [Klebsiella electrica]QDI09203.1 Membrane-bound metallopeptidase [Klebsiella electrica]